MAGEIVRRAARGEPVTRQANAAVVQAADLIYDEVRLSGLEIEGIIALAGHAMQGVMDLDAYRRSLAADDLSLHSLLGDIQGQAIQQIKQVQRDLFSDWGV